MMNDKRDPLVEAVTAVGTCQNALKKLRDTCCMSERSAKMITLGDEMQALAKTLKGDDARATFEPDSVIASVENVGAALGALYATCCTPTRERLYTEMFKALGAVHRDMWRLKGVTH